MEKQVWKYKIARRNWRPSHEMCLNHKLQVSRKQLLKFLIRIWNTG